MTTSTTDYINLYYCVILLQYSRPNNIISIIIHNSVLIGVQLNSASDY